MEGAAAACTAACSRCSQAAQPAEKAGPDAGAVLRPFGAIATAVALSPHRQPFSRTSALPVKAWSQFEVAGRAGAARGPRMGVTLRLTRTCIQAL